ncbi:MAG: hypothetical protein ACFCUN_06000 [Hyphomicrobiaceae bacterium]
MELKHLALWVLAGGLTVGVLYAIWAMQGIAVRYILAMAFAAAAALVTTLFLASPVASYVTHQMTFESPDGAADVHMFTFLGVNALALFIGWSIGWLVSRPFAERQVR